MPQGSADIVFFAAIGSTFTASIVLWRRPWLGLFFAAIILIATWILLCMATEASIQHRIDLIEAKAASGKALSLEEQMFDGVGNRLGVLLFGWLPAVVGLVPGSILAFVMRRVRNSRRNT